MRRFTAVLALLWLFTAGAAAGCGTKHAGTGTKVLTPRPTDLTSTSSHWSMQASDSSCLFSIIEQADATSACVDAAGVCHAYAYKKKAGLLLEELDATAAKRVCRDIGLAFKKPK